MINLRGNPGRPGSGLGRREFLKIGGTGTLGLGLGDWLGLLALTAMANAVNALAVQTTAE